MHMAIIAKVTEVVAIPGADKIHVAKVLGESCIVSKEVGVGYIGVLFPVDLQLSEEYCKSNNLFRKAENNADITKTGFFEENRRVRAQPFLKVSSSGYFASLESLPQGFDKLELGDSFDTVNGYKICQKYVSQATRQAIEKATKNSVKQAKLCYAPLFEKHLDSKKFKHEAHLIPKGALLTFTAKQHGTSFRLGYSKLDCFLPTWKKKVNHWLNKEIFPEFEFGYVSGSRNVVFKPSKEIPVGFHGEEGFRYEVAKEIEPYLEKGMQCFGEIVGNVNNKPVMPSHNIKALKDKAFTKKYGDVINYNYLCKKTEYKFMIYRLTHLNANGENVDFTQKQMEAFCQKYNLPHTFEVAPQEVYDGDLEKLINKVTQLTERPEVLTEDYIDPSHISEGIVIRCDFDGMKPTFYKSKSYAFSVCEGIEECVNTEDVEAA